MEFTWFDITVGAILLISGLLALSRGFTRELTSLVAWALAGVAAVFVAFSPEIVAKVQAYIPDKQLAQIAAAAGTFLIALVILSLISIRLTDWLLDSAPGAFDRSLGFLYGLARGFAVVLIAYLFFIWWSPPAQHPQGIRAARAVEPIEKVGIFLIDQRIIPENIGKVLKAKTYIERHKNARNNDDTNQTNDTVNNNDKKDIDRLIENSQKKPNTQGN